MLNRPAPSIVSQDLNGNLVNLDNYQGQVVVLNFWGSWCVPCQLEMPRFAAWQKKYGPQGLQLLGVSMDDNPSVARKVSIDLKLDYPVIMGDVRLGTLYGGILGLPVTYLIGRDGQIRARFQGDAKLKDIEAKIVELLAQH